MVDIKARNRDDGLHHLPYFDFICDPGLPDGELRATNGHHRFEFVLMGQTREHMEQHRTRCATTSRNYIDVDKFEILRTLVYTFNALMAEALA